MRLIGYPLDPVDDAAVGAAGPRRHHGITLSQLIAAGLLLPGSQIEYTGRGHQDRVATIESDGSILLDGTRFASPSAAGAAVRGGAVNGWEYWAQRDAAGDLVPLGVIRTGLQPPDA